MPDDVACEALARELVGDARVDRDHEAAVVDRLEALARADAQLVVAGLEREIADLHAAVRVGLVAARRERGLQSCTRAPSAGRERGSSG